MKKTFESEVLENFAGTTVTKEELESVLGKNRKYWYGPFLKKANYISVTCLVRRSMFELVGGFDDKFLEDWELWKKIATKEPRLIGL